jgi:hypothetical protein
VIEGTLEGRIEMTGRRGRRRKQLLDDLKEKRRRWKLKEEALDRTLWRTRFVRGYRPVVRQTTEWMNTFGDYTQLRPDIDSIQGCALLILRLSILVRMKPLTYPRKPTPFSLNTDLGTYTLVKTVLRTRVWIIIIFSLSYWLYFFPSI